MTNVLVRMAIALLLLETGFVSHGQLDRSRADISALLPPSAPDHRRSIRIILLLGEDDCQDAVSFVELLTATVVENHRVSQAVVVAGSTNAVQLVRTSLENRTSALPLVRASFRQLRTLGINPARHLARLLVIDSRGNTLLQALVPASPKEAAAIVSLATSIVQRELARS